MSGTQVRTRSVAAAVAAGIVGAVLLPLAPLAVGVAAATPPVPDLTGLIDAGPVPSRAHPDELTGTALFRTGTGIACAEIEFKVTQSLQCFGDFPGQPVETTSVGISAVYHLVLDEAFFGPYNYAQQVGDTTGWEPLLLEPGHKVVLWDDGPNESLTCGIPETAELVCVLNAPYAWDGADTDEASPPVSSGFVIAEPESWVF